VKSRKVQYGYSTISHKAEVLPEAKAEGPQRKEEEEHSKVSLSPLYI
jgi:hypothetical protein